MRVRSKTKKQRTRKAKPRPPLLESEAELTLAEHALQIATRLSSRGGRSERECGLSSPGREIEELLPAAQAFADAQTRAALRQLNLEANVAALRPAKAIETDDARKIFLSKFLKTSPTVKGHALALAFDKAGLRLLDGWEELCGSRLWMDAWAHPKTFNSCRKYLSVERRAALQKITAR